MTRRCPLHLLALIGLQAWVFLGFCAFEGLTALQEWRYRRGTRALQEVHARRVRWAGWPTVAVTTSTYVRRHGGPAILDLD